MPLPSGLFITGTDTGVGKSEVTAALAAALVADGITVYPRKPVESGCLPNTHEEPLFPQDGYQLQQASGNREPLQTITPYRFEHALSPDRAAQLAGVTLTLEQLTRACQTPNNENSTALIEGAGGFYSPIANNALNADLAQSLGYPLVLVAEDRLGGVNQVLLARDAILSRGLRLVAIVLNCAAPTDERGNCSAIEARVNEPVIPLPSSDGATPWKRLQGHITPLIAALESL